MAKTPHAWTGLRSLRKGNHMTVAVVYARARPD